MNPAKKENNNNKEFPKKQFLKKLPFVFIVFFAIIAVLLTISFTKAGHFFSVINGGAKISEFDSLFPVDEKITLYKDANRVNFLLLGLRGENDAEHGGLLTDTMIVASINEKKKTASFISIPRDIYIKIPGTNKKDKINAAYLIGEEKLPGGGGMELSKRTVEYITALKIDHIIAVDFKAFTEIVDELGGVDIYLEKEFAEDKQWGVDFHIASGWQHLDGDTALYYARSRYSTNDFDRGRRQQQLLIAIKKKAQKEGLLTNPFKINSIMKILENRLRTDLTILDIAKYSKLAQQIKDDSIKSTTFSTENELNQTFINGIYVLLPKTGNFERIREISKNILN